MSQLNPLDHVEQILVENNWAFDRMTEDELSVQISGKSCDYNLFFIWQESLSALQFRCEYDLPLDPLNVPSAAMALMDINSLLWIGHFEIDRKTLTPAFRQTCLLRGLDELSGPESMQDMVTIALAQCERFKPLFELLAMGEKATPKAISLALIQPAGES